MNTQQFKTLAKLMRLRSDSVNYRGVQLALVDGHNAPTVARMLAVETGGDSKVIYPTVFNAIKRAKVFINNCKIIVDV